MATCDTGTVIGGGGYAHGTDDNMLVASHFTEDHTGWYVKGTDSKKDVTAYVICAA